MWKKIQAEIHQYNHFPNTEVAKREKEEREGKEAYFLKHKVGHGEGE